MDLIKTYEHALRAQRSDSNTSRTYAWAARVFSDFLTEHSLQLGRLDLGMWLAFGAWIASRRHPDGRLWAPRSIRTAVKGARHFLRSCASQQLCPSLPDEAWEQIRLPAAPEQRAVGLTQSQLGVYLSAAAQIDEPYKTVFALLPLMGQRIQEICSTPLAGVQPGASGTVLHVRRKGDSITFHQIALFSPTDCSRHLHAVPLSRQAVATIKAYLRSYRRDPAFRTSPWLFPAASDPRRFVPPDTARHVFRELRQRSGLGAVTTHQAGRHTLAEAMVAAGAPMSAIAGALGHKSPRTTEEIYARVRPERVRDAVGGALVHAGLGAGG